MGDSARLADPSLITSRGVDADTGAGPGAITVPSSPFSVALTLAIEFVSRLSALQQRLPSADTMALVASTAVATLVLFYIARYLLFPKWGKAISSPLRASLPSVSPDVIKSHVYHPEVLPGARDVTTPVRSPPPPTFPLLLHSPASDMELTACE